MKIALTAFTRRGAALARMLAGSLAADCALSFGEKLDARGYGSVTDWAGERFADSDALIFVGACGIAVRAVSPYVRDKFTDPAVVCVDEYGRYAVPLLSGHVGGANRLAKEVALLTGGQAAIGTATDLNGVFAVDLWAKERNLTISDRRLAKEISAALLDGGTVRFRSDFPCQSPAGLIDGPSSLEVWVTARSGGGSGTLRLIPKRLTLGIGCRKGVSEADILAAVRNALADWDLAAVKAVRTIDLKRDEPGLLSFCQSLGLPLTVCTADELRAVPGEFTGSEFVASVTGVDNVCERAAALSGGELVVKKRALNGVTVAAALDRSVLTVPEGGSEL